MSVIVEVVKPQTRISKPVIRAECSGCRCVYVTSACKSQVRRLRRCQRCRPHAGRPR